MTIIEEKIRIKPNIQLKKIYIHIGIEKTGTTAIQSFLKQNTKLLADVYKIQVPIWENDDTINTHYRISKAFVPNKEMAPQYPTISIENFKTILDAFEKAEHLEKLIISSEIFSYSSANEIKELKEVLQNFEVTIIAFLRRQDEYIESLYNQHIKRIWTMGRPPIDKTAFANYKKLDFHKFILQWYNSGFTNIDLKIYGLSKAKDFIFYQFFENIDPSILDNENVIIDEHIANPSLSLFHTILINQYVPQIKDEPLRKNAADLIFKHNMFYSQISNRKILVSKTHYSKEYKTELIKKHEQSNAELLKLFPNAGFSKHSLFQPVKEFSDPLSLKDISKEQIMMYFFNMLLYFIKNFRKEKQS